MNLRPGIVRRFVVETVLFPVQTVAFWVVKRYSETTRSHGVDILLFTEGSQEAVARVIHALDLISVHDPVWIRRITRFRAIVVLEQGGPEYHPEKNICVFSKEYLEGRSKERVALDLVHEATHARLHQLGFSYDGDQRDRIERACIRSELRLARRLPSSEELSAHVVAASEEPWWAEERLSARRDKQLQELGVSGWLRSILRWVRKVRNGS